MDPSLPPLIRALCDPRLYPGAPQVDVLQTHGAWVLLAGDSAYKIKKPVKFDFMDFSTLALRQAACEAEIRVNRPFAPTKPGQAIYRGVLPIVGSPEAPRWGQAGADDAAAIEFAVHMRRFDEAGRLDHLCERGALQPTHMVQLAQRLAQVQATAPTAPSESPWGRPEAVQRVVQDNLQTLHQLLSVPAELGEWQALQSWTDSQWPLVSRELAHRRAQGRVREGHGDLHLANLVLLDDEVVPFDAIEFNEALRWVDVASDLAFTWMDLQRQGQPGLAHLLLSEWIDASGDVSAPAVLPFFAVYLALVRAKVAAIRLGQMWPATAGLRSPRFARDDQKWNGRDDQKGNSRHDQEGNVRDDQEGNVRDDQEGNVRDDQEGNARDDGQGNARDDDKKPSSRAQRSDLHAPITELQKEIHTCLQLAKRLAWPESPQLIITHGLSGSGKSHTATRWLLQHGGSRALRLRSDVERKRLHGMAALQASDPAHRSVLYGPQASELTYASLRERAAELLRAGWTVLVDAAFLRRHEREAFAQLAQAQGCPFGILAPQAPVDVLRQRIAQRQDRGGDPSEATLEVLENQLKWIEPLGPDEPRLLVE